MAQIYSLGIILYIYLLTSFTMPLSQPNVVPLDRILVIDDLPLIPLAFQEIFRSLNPAARVEYSANIFTALSAKAFVSEMLHTLYYDNGLR